jgi:hypothetical protein
MLRVLMLLRSGFRISSWDTVPEGGISTNNSVVGRSLSRTAKPGDRGHQLLSSDTYSIYCSRYLPPRDICDQVLFAATSAFLVREFAPYAAGSGISEIKCIIAGFTMKGFLSFTT